MSGSSLSVNNNRVFNEKCSEQKAYLRRGLTEVFLQRLCIIDNYESLAKESCLTKMILNLTIICQNRCYAVKNHSNWLITRKICIKWAFKIRKFCYHSLNKLTVSCHSNLSSVTWHRLLNYEKTLKNLPTIQDQGQHNFISQNINTTC